MANRYPNPSDMRASHPPTTSASPSTPGLIQQQHMSQQPHLAPQQPSHHSQHYQQPHPSHAHSSQQNPIHPQPRQDDPIVHAPDLHSQHAAFTNDPNYRPSSSLTHQPLVPQAIPHANRPLPISSATPHQVPNVSIGQLQQQPNPHNPSIPYPAQPSFQQQQANHIYTSASETPSPAPGRPYLPVPHTAPPQSQQSIPYPPVTHAQATPPFHAASQQSHLPSGQIVPSSLPNGTRQPIRPLPPDARVADVTTAMAGATIGHDQPSSAQRPQFYSQSPQAQRNPLGVLPPRPLITNPLTQQTQQQQFSQSQLPSQFQPTAIGDPASLPRPDLSSHAISARIAQGDPPPPAPPAASFADPSAISSSSLTASGPVACAPEHFVPTSIRAVRLSNGLFPSSAAIAKKYGLPLGAIIQPMVQPIDAETSTPVVNFGSTGIVRCRRCRSYINPWCRFQDGGRRWMCSLCQYPNDVPSDYFSPVDQRGYRRDAAERPELHRGSIEFVAPAEYMVRPPMPPVFLFVLETTPSALNSGALAAMISGIKLSLDALPQEGRTRIGLITFDSSVNFFNLPSGEDAEPSICTIADISNMFLPSPEGILVHLSECRTAFTKALDIVGSACKTVDQNQQTRQPQALSAPSCLGAALQGAQKVIEHTGGKIVVLLTSRPTIGPGTLRDRGDPAAMFTDRERAILRPDTTFYRQIGVECVKFQISCDLFICPPPPGHYIDVATIGQLAKITGGEIFRSGTFEAYRDHGRLQRAVYRTLSRETGFEAVMRIRATKSIRCSQFMGRFFIRSTDLLAMPNVDCDKSYSVMFSFEDSVITDGSFCVQVALLYTTSGGERRIRVHTVCVPVSNSITDMFLRVDSVTTGSLYTRLAADAVKDRVLDEMKKNFVEKIVTSLAVYRTDCMQQYSVPGGFPPGPSHLFVPDAMNLLPLFVHCLLKTPLLSRDAAAACLYRIDDKAMLIHAIDTMNVAQTAALLYPNLMNVLPVSGSNDPKYSGGSHMPGARASVTSLKSDVAVLIDDGKALLLWLGAAVVQSFSLDVLQCPPQALANGVDPRQLEYKLMEPGELKGSAAHVRSVINRVSALRPAGTPLYVVPAGSSMQPRVEALCIEDRTAATAGYKEFLTELQRQVSAKTSRK